MKSFMITTPLYYVNSVPHIGHAYTTIAADVLARWKRMQGHDVFFLTGTDEHGAKIAQAAEQSSKTPKEFVDDIAAKFKDMWTALDITYTDFIQTTEDRHKKVVQDVFRILKSSGDIYKGSYEAWYCISDESFFSDRELTDKKCPQCGRDVQKIKEDSYFFKLSKYQDALLAHFESHPEFLSPKNRANEILNFVKSGLNDLSISRTNVKWGVPVPDDSAHTIYVWFDALLNYITAPGVNLTSENPNVPPFSDRWPADVQIVGKEIYRFHTVIWPAMLMALKLPLPKIEYAHGWWTVEGTKMSKSLGNVVDPHVVVAEYGLDAFRYFLLREVPFGADGDYSDKALLLRYNSELANNLGNLLQRTTTILLKNLDGEIPPAKGNLSLLNDLPGFLSEIDGAISRLAFGEALEKIYGLMLRTNKYIDDQAPWTLGPEDKDRLGEILLECLSVLKVLGLVLYPFMPQKMEILWSRLGESQSLKDGAPALLKKLSTDPNATTTLFAAGQKVVKDQPLFMRKGGRWK